MGKRSERDVEKEREEKEVWERGKERGEREKEREGGERWIGGIWKNKGREGGEREKLEVDRGEEISTVFVNEPSAHRVMGVGTDEGEQTNLAQSTVGAVIDVALAAAVPLS